MTTLPEKLRILHNVSIFAAVDPRALEPLAEELEPLEVPAGTPIFAKGDPADALYVLAAGRVRVHDGDMLINFLEPGDVFGEMAVLDSSPRSASVTAEADSLLLRLDQDHLYALMQREITVTRGIIEVLCGHLRARVSDMARDFEYLRQFARVTGAARALEAGEYRPDALDEVARREDELGGLARIFQRMAREVELRERNLRLEVQRLRIEIDRTRQQREVAEITGSEYFRSLRAQAERLRADVGGEE
jgi:CRP-like cAMP-binding protein